MALTDDEQRAVLGQAAGLTKHEIGVICAWSAQKSFGLIRSVEKKLGVHRQDFSELVEEVELITPPVKGYRVRRWWTTRCGRIKIDHIRSLGLPDGVKLRYIEELPVLTKATKHTIKQAAWWARFGRGDVLGISKAVTEKKLIHAGWAFGYDVERVTDDNGNEIDGPAIYAVKVAPSLVNRIGLAMGSGPELVGVEVLAEAFGLDMSDGPKMIERAVEIDPRYTIEMYRKKPAVKVNAAS